MQDLELMQTPIEERRQESTHPKEALGLAKRLSERLRQRYGALVKAIVLSQPQHIGYHHADPDAPLGITVILDDVSKELTKEKIDEYVSAGQIIISQISSRLKIKSVRLSQFYEGVQSLKSESIELLRNSVVLHDKGFVTPMQLLLHEGRIKPTYEAMGVYFARTQLTMRNSKDHVLAACVDLYWAIIDAAHAILMQHGVLPPSPREVAQLIRNTIVPKGTLADADCRVIEEMVDLYKAIMHKQITSIDGHAYDVYQKKVQAVVSRIKQRLREHAGF